MPPTCHSLEVSGSWHFLSGVFLYAIFHLFHFAADVLASGTRYTSLMCTLHYWVTGYTQSGLTTPVCDSPGTAFQFSDTWHLSDWGSCSLFSEVQCVTKLRVANFFKEITVPVVCAGNVIMLLMYTRKTVCSGNSFKE